MNARPALRRIGRIALGAAAAGFGYVAYVYLTLPDVRPLASRNPTTTAFMELRDREARAAGRTPRRVQRWVSYRRISPNLTRAVLVAEDAAFWDHDGVDYAELQKSIEIDWQRGALTRGASTITQQLAKNLYLSPSRNPIRKLRELLITRRLEAELSKARILELYLNVIEWGDGIYGVEAASQAYFGVPASALDPDQAALLAGAIINPRVHNPARPTARLVSRQKIIRGRMRVVTPPPAPPEPPVAGVPLPSLGEAAPPPPPSAEPLPSEPPSSAEPPESAPPVPAPFPEPAPARPDR
jgi:monofunctional biosynthetic peptidoglycan transglycosylase